MIGQLLRLKTGMIVACVCLAVTCHSFVSYAAGFLAQPGSSYDDHVLAHDINRQGDAIDPLPVVSERFMHKRPDIDSFVRGRMTLDERRSFVNELRVDQALRFEVSLYRRNLPDGTVRISRRAQDVLRKALHAFKTGNGLLPGSFHSGEINGKHSVAPQWKSYYHEALRCYKGLIEMGELEDAAWENIARIRKNRSTFDSHKETVYATLSSYTDSTVPGHGEIHYQLLLLNILGKLDRELMVKAFKHILHKKSFYDKAVPIVIEYARRHNLREAKEDFLRYIANGRGDAESTIHVATLLHEWDGNNRDRHSAGPVNRLSADHAGALLSQRSL